MRVRIVVQVIVAFITILILPMAAHAKEAAVSGTITDASGGVRPGVTVRAVHEATGNAFETVTDSRGAYRLAVRTGAIRITAALQGFAPLTRSVELLVGQTAVVNAQLAPSGIAETVTVTGEAPLIETTTSTLGGNIDPRQIQELPVNGRNWIALAMLAPGSRTVPVASSRENSEKPLPDRNNNETREFQLNVDGQQVSADTGTGGQPRYSQDSIAEFQFISNRVHATMGRSSRLAGNAVIKGGAHRLPGPFRTHIPHRG